MFSAQLRLPSDMTTAEKSQRVDSIIEELVGTDSCHVLISDSDCTLVALFCTLYQRTTLPHCYDFVAECINCFLHWQAVNNAPSKCFRMQLSKTLPYQQMEGHTVIAYHHNQTDMHAAMSGCKSFLGATMSRHNLVSLGQDPAKMLYRV